MGVAIGASGILGVAIETVIGTYLAPTKYIPFNTESLKINANMVERRPIRNTAGLGGLIPGYSNVEGDIEIDVTVDTLLYFIIASRATYVKSGTGPYVYTFTPSSSALAGKTLSISIKRNAEVFGYTGCVVQSYTIAVGDDGKMTCTISIIGMDEATQAALTATWPTSPVFGAGMYNLQIPTSTQVYDTDTFEFSVNDNGSPNPRIGNTKASKFTSLGESSASIKIARDFDTRAEYDTFKAGTAKSVTMIATSGADIVNMLMPVSVTNTYEINIGGVGDLLRASIEYSGVIDSTGKAYQLVLTTAENVT